MLSLGGRSDGLGNGVSITNGERQIEFPAPAVVDIQGMNNAWETSQSVSSLRRRKRRRRRRINFEKHSSLT